MTKQTEERTGPGGLPYRPCAGVVLTNPDRLIFAGQRFDRPGAWQMPQGGIDKGETVREAAIRELGEETGLPPDSVEILAEAEGWFHYDLPPELVGKIWKGKYGGQRQKWVLMRLTGTDDLINIQTAHPEFDRWQWMTADALLDSIVPFKREVYVEVLAQFRDHLA